jgi:nitroreductase
MLSFKTVRIHLGDDMETRPDPANPKKAALAELASHRPIAPMLLVLVIGLVAGCNKSSVVETKPTEVRKLPPPQLNQVSLKQALQNRVSTRTFSPRPLDEQTLSNLLWAADGINRPATGGRTAPSAYDWRYLDLYLTDAQGFARYNATLHAIERLGNKDIRALAGEQDFVKDAPLTIVFVSDEGKMDPKKTGDLGAIFSGVSAGAIAQNVYLYCASAGLNVVVRASIDRDLLHKALGLNKNQKIIVGQTIGFPP